MYRIPIKKRGDCFVYPSYIYNYIIHNNISVNIDTEYSVLEIDNENTYNDILQLIEFHKEDKIFEDNNNNIRCDSNHRIIDDYIRHYHNKGGCMVSQPIIQKTIPKQKAKKGKLF